MSYFKYFGFLFLTLVVTLEPASAAPIGEHDFKGDWRKSCTVYNQEDALTEHLRIGGQELKHRYTAYEDFDCKTPYLLYGLDYTFELSQKNALTLTYQKVWYSSLTDEVTRALNLVRFCGVHNWKTGVIVDVTGKVCDERQIPRQGATLTQKFSLEDNQLRWGNDPQTFERISQWQLQDVSYLFPLPKSLTENKLLSLDAQDSLGPLIAEKYYAQLPPLVFHLHRNHMRTQLRVVGMRIDPCFGETPAPLQCEPQIRLSWQIFETDRQQKITTADAALHTFYKLEKEEFNRLSKELQLLKYKYTLPDWNKAPLQIHRQMQAPHAADFQSDLQKIILKYAGQKNMRRLTAMVLRGNKDIWVFAAFDVNPDKLEMAPVARLDGRLSQSFLSSDITGQDLLGASMAPQPTQGDFSHLFNQPQLSEEQVREALQNIADVENPRRHVPDTADCVSCHVAMSTRQWVQSSWADYKLTWEQYENPRHPLDNLSPLKHHTQNLRAFGYFQDQMAISDRTIFESAEVADLLSRQ